MSNTSEILRFPEDSKEGFRNEHPDSAIYPFDEAPALAKLKQLFDGLFVVAENTELIGGANEPIYLPVSSTRARNQIIYTRNYFSSALHEIAHWCVAGAERRKQEDYGYWYAPDGRSQSQQQAFEKVEVKPQALEWIFSKACGKKFRISADNLDAGIGASESFKLNVYQQVRNYCEGGVNPRTHAFAFGLVAVFRDTRWSAKLFDPNSYCLTELD